ncbi:hypothetical protein JNUCC42_07430 [Brevibacterium sp. JNUCC-42]|nr:hypothetical protein JNUCC42_07430 [Brevibacterium sp. JNUCC-42]
MKILVIWRQTDFLYTTDLGGMHMMQDVAKVFLTSSLMACNRSRKKEIVTTLIKRKQQHLQTLMRLFYHEIYLPNRDQL